MGFYRSYTIERPMSYCTWYIPDYTPRKAEFGKMLSETGSISEDQKQTVSSLSPEQKERFRKQLHYGNGDMTLQEWDDFLADLVEYGIITNDERYYVDGSFLETGEDARIAPHEVLDKWDGDPLEFRISVMRISCKIRSTAT